MEKIKQYWQKINMDSEYFSLRFFVAGIVLSFSFLLLFISLSKTYTSSIIILVNAKSETAAQQKDQIISNVSEFPKTLALYDRLLKYNSDVKDFAAGKSSTERKDYWNGLVSTKKIGRDSSLIKISINTKQKNDAEKLAEKTTETLFYFTAFYYDIKKDLDLLIVEGPITRPRIAGILSVIPLSLILGFLLTFIFQYTLIKRKDLLIESYKESKEKFLFNLQNKSGEKKSEKDELKSLEDLYMSDIPAEIKPAPKEEQGNIFTRKFQEMKKLTKILEKNTKYPNFAEVPKYNGGKGDAPDNLPVADDFSLNKTMEEPNQEKTEEKKINKTYPEPDMEKLKKRLNALLKGEL